MTTLIDWCDETLNPQGWGCWGPGGKPEAPRRCWYCYLHRLVRWPGSDCELCQQLIPHWHEERLEQPLRWRRPRRIFWQSTGDLFHPCTPTWQIAMVIGRTVMHTPQHTHIFCTKNPARYQEFPWPKNVILLTTVTKQEDDWRIAELLKADCRVRGVSAEPLFGSLSLRTYFNSFQSMPWPTKAYPKIHWLIIGALTGKRSRKHKPDPAWVQSLIDQGRAAGVPVFLKDNLKWPERIQEFPG